MADQKSLQSSEESSKSAMIGFDLPAAPQGERLIAQFIIDQLMRIQRLLFATQEAAVRYQGVRAQVNSKGRQFILSVLLKLARESTVKLPVQSWSYQETILSQMKRYVMVAQKHKGNKIAGDPLLSFQHYIESLEQQSLNLMHALLKGNESFSYQDALARMVTTVNSCMHHCSAWIKQFTEDENLLLYMLRNKNEISTLFGRDCFDDLVCKTFGTPGEIGEFLMTRYSKRGFDNFIPTFRKLLASLNA